MTAITNQVGYRDLEWSPPAKGTTLPLYEFRCAADCGPFERSFPMADVPGTTRCPRCDRDAVRRVSPPRLGHGLSSAMNLLDRTKRSAHEPDVITGPPPPATAGRSSVTSNPLHRRLPRP
ncbi:FmdB family zinc ribbon protein [Rhodococcus sp. JVH1]|uniref:FmdB family zinc ribbon protein n=1 Tax=Rhodococcus sp. JVH1 TaxID=745408 RepID=UPI000271EF03|nr:FmdB family zinc ribbon protein [Rhodococcus sp. JVH1]EJI99954.1 regulatory protein family protein [Rhodococcus sp. JVH1]